MSRVGRWALITAAWVGPLLWLALWASLTPSDGTVVTRPGAVLGEGRWGESMLVLDTYGATPLRPGDQIMAIEDAQVSALGDGSGLEQAARGDVLRYLVRRRGPGLTVQQEVEVPLRRYA